MQLHTAFRIETEPTSAKVFKDGLKEMATVLIEFSGIVCLGIREYFGVNITAPLILGF